MNNFPIGKTEHTSYENFVAKCPLCDSVNIFNRASDLGTFEPIGSHNVSCQNAECGKHFCITNDSINDPHETLINDCEDLIRQKHYMNCVLTVTQAYEVFFSLFLRVELVFKPSAAESRFRLRDVNQLLEDLRKNTKKYTLDDLRALVLRHIVSGCSPNNLAAAKSLVARLSTKPKTPNKLTINKLSDPKLKRLLKSLKGANVNTLRNRVVHKNAYRPSRQEAEAALQEARDILFPLQKYFQIRNDLNWYRIRS